MPRFKLLALVVAFAALGAGCSKKTESGEPSAGGGSSSADQDKLQGMWKIETLEDGRPDSPRRQEEIKNDRIKIDGDKLTILADGDEIKFTFKLDEAKTPKVMTLTEVIDSKSRLGGSPTFRGTKKTEPPPAREPEKWDWIYKFEGETLVVAFTKDHKKPHPTDFKAKEAKFDNPDKVEPGVTVVTLKKTTEPPPPRAPRTYTTSRAGTKK